MRCGGISSLKQADHEVQSIVDQVKPVLEKQTGKQFTTFKAVLYATQVVR